MILFQHCAVLKGATSCRISNLLGFLHFDSLTAQRLVSDSFPFKPLHVWTIPTRGAGFGSNCQLSQAGNWEMLNLNLMMFLIFLERFLQWGFSSMLLHAVLCKRANLGNTQLIWTCSLHIWALTDSTRPTRRHEGAENWSEHCGAALQRVASLSSWAALAKDFFCTCHWGQLDVAMVWGLLELQPMCSKPPRALVTDARNS